MKFLEFFTNREKAMEEKYKTFIRVSKTGAWEYFPDTKLLWFSDEYFMMLNRNPEDYKPFNNSALQRCWIDLLHDEDRPFAVKSFEEYLENENQVLYENYFRLKNTDGHYTWILSRALKMVNSKGKVTKIVGTHINISELKALEQRKMDYERQLHHSRKLEALGTLSGGIAHDFNNILGAIIGNTELAKIFVNKPDMQIPCLDSIESASLKGKAMVEKILNFAKTDTKNYKPMQIADIIHEVTKFIKPTIPQNIVIQTEINADPYILGDTVQLYQVLVNLITNAIQAIEEDSGIIEIILNQKSFDTRWQNRFVDIHPGEYVQLEIIDSGKGMDEYTLDKIFEPFFTTKEKSGTGLGMFLVYGIIKSHGGTISVYSAPGEGARFSLFFPVYAEPANTIPQQTLVKQPSQGNNELIYIIDDDEGMCLITSKLLENENYQTKMFTSTTKALAEIQANHDDIALIISDIFMPELNGFNFVKKLNQEKIDIPVILCTGYKAAHNKFPSDLPTENIIYKPFSGKDISAMVQKVLNWKNDHS